MLEMGFLAWAFPMGSALFALALTVIGRLHPLACAARWGAAGFALTTIAVTIDTLRPELPLAIVALAAPFHFLALALLLQAFLSRHRETIPVRVIAVVLAIGVAVHFLFQFVIPDVGMRVINSTAVATVLAVMALARLRGQTSHAIDRAAFALIVAMMLIHIGRLAPFIWDAAPYAVGSVWTESRDLVLFYIAAAFTSIVAALLLLIATGLDIIEHHMIASQVDPLTGISNRRALDSRIDDDREGRRRFGAVLMIDLDEFKQINDAHGHDGGDAVLVAVAQALERAVGGEGCLARVGGEEFALLVVRARAHRAGELATAAREAIATAVATEPCAGITVTASVGFAQRVPGEDLKTTLRRADVALYRAKADGRDRAVEADGETALYGRRAEDEAEERVAFG